MDSRFRGNDAEGINSEVPYITCLISLHVVSRIVQAARRTVDNHEYSAAVYQPEDSLAGHLEFTLKYKEGLISFRRALFRVVDAAAQS